MNKLKETLFVICLTFLVLSAFFNLFEWSFVPVVVPYVYAVSGAGVAVYLLTTTYQGKNLRLKRLNIQQVIAAIALPFSSYRMFDHKNDWFVLLLVSSVLILYIVLVKGYEEKKEKKENTPPLP
jgi:4-amino-4-deoxy-L-arabinose transferase-like glycosyltransferase